jgi:hypothetical protein
VLVSFGPAAAPALHALLADVNVDPAVRAVCADALAVLGADTADDTAVAVLDVGGDVDLLAACLRLLRGPASPAHLSTVRRLCQAQDDVVRGQAVACLARLGEASDRGILEAALDDASPWVVRSAERGLSMRATGAADALPAGSGGAG